MGKQTVGQKVKGHFKKHKVKYIVGAAGVVGVGVGISIGMNLRETATVSMDVINDISPTNVAIGKDIHIENKTEVVNNVTNTINMGGPVRKIVRRLSDGKLYGSVQEAARDAGASKTSMSNHLNGRLEHVNGEQYIIEGLATG